MNRSTSVCVCVAAAQQRVCVCALHAHFFIFCRLFSVYWWLGTFRSSTGKNERNRRRRRRRRSKRETRERCRVCKCLHAYACERVKRQTKVQLETFSTVSMHYLHIEMRFKAEDVSQQNMLIIFGWAVNGFATYCTVKSKKSGLYGSFNKIQFDQLGVSPAAIKREMFSIVVNLLLQLYFKYVK